MSAVLKRKPMLLKTAAPPSSTRRGRPPGKFTQHHRMSELWQLLHRHPKGVTLHEIASCLKVTPRSARRYLREIKGDLEAIPEQPGGQKRWRIPAVDLPRRVAIRRTQAYALLAARELFEPMRGSTLYEEIDLAAQTLLGVARRPGRGPNAGVTDARLEERFRYLPFAPTDYSHQVEDLDNLFQAVADLRPLSCRYPGADPTEQERLVLHPYALLLYKDAIYCLALDTGRGEVRTFMLDGISDSHCVDAPRFELPADFFVDDFLQGQFGIWRREGPAHEVIIDFNSAVCDYALSRQVHPTQRVEPLESGGVRMRLEITDLTEVTAWVLGFGSLAEVVAPTELRARVADELTRALGRYQ